MRPLRFVPAGGSVVEVTVRTHQSQFLLRPSPVLNEIVGGVLGRAQALFPVRCHAAVFLSSHFHLLLSVDDAKQQADFMRHLNTNLSLEINRLLDREGTVWGDRYRAILVSEEEAAQVGRFRYILAQSVKEGLVAHARDWPGIHSVREILAGEPVRGTWFNRTQEYSARNRREDFGRLQYATEEVLELTTLPCWAHLPQEVYRQRVAELMEEIESETAAELAKAGREPLGVDAVLRQDPETRPARSKKSPAPLFHAATKAVRKAFWEAYALFVAAFREASERLKSGDRTARFPMGSFPPGLPFVTEAATGPP
jgi:REP element-mobilizing transposase RayT